jgi:hypothetical protein
MEASKSKLLKKMAKAAGMALIPGASLGAAIAGKVKNNSTRKMNQAKKDFMSAEQRKSPPRSSAPIDNSGALFVSPRPQARAKPSNMRPKARPARIEQEAAEAGAVERGNRAAKRRAQEEKLVKAGSKVKKMASGGGVCRGMGAAKRGGNFVVG